MLGVCTAGRNRLALDALLSLGLHSLVVPGTLDPHALCTLSYRAHCVRYPTEHTVYTILQSTLCALSYRAHCVRYPTEHTVYAILQSTLSVRYPIEHTVYASLQSTLSVR